MRKCVALFSDKHMLPGLHVVLRSMLDSLPEGGFQLDIYVFLDRVSESEKRLLEFTHSADSKGTKLIIQNFTPRAPDGGNSLHGNNTAYGRLYLADLLPHAGYCLYIDSDVVVARSVLDAFQEFDDAHVLFVAYGPGTRRASVDRQLYKDVGLNMEQKAFNSGVMGINLRLWRERKVMRRCLTIAETHRGMFRSADQALLNVVLHDSLKVLDDSWNSFLSPSAPCLKNIEPRIYHFVGSPKPWDPLGSRLHQNYMVWNRFHAKTAIREIPLYRYWSFVRTLRISRMAFLSWKKITKKGKNIQKR